MGTTPSEDDAPVGIIQRTGKQARIITEATVDTAYGGRGRGSAYPLLLILVLAVVIVGSSTPVSTITGAVSLMLLALWVGGRR